MEKLILFKYQDQLKNTQLKGKGKKKKNEVHCVSCSYAVHTVIKTVP